MANRGLAGLFAGLILLGCVAGIVVPAGLGWDFANFYDAGRRVAAGQASDLYNPDSLIAGQPPQGKTGFYGSPLSAVLYVPLAGLSPNAALVWFKIENVAAFLLSFWLLYGFYRRIDESLPGGRWDFATLFAGACLIFQPFWTVFRVGGQTTPTALLLLSAAMLFHTNARFWGSALCVVLAALIKPALAPAVLFLMVVSGLSFAWRTAAVLLGAGLLSLAIVGWPAHAAFLTLMREAGQGTWIWYFNSSIYLLIDNVQSWIGPTALSGDYRPVFSGLTIAVQAGVVAGIAWLTIMAHRERWTAAAIRHFDFMMAVLLFLFWSRTVWEHYLSVLFLPLVFVLAARSRFSRNAVLLIGAVFALSMFQNLIFTNWLRATFGFQSLPALVAIALFKSAPLLLTAGFLWRYQRELFASYAAWPESPARSGGSARVRA